MKTQALKTTTVTMFTRHADTCPHKGDRGYQGKGCNCRKYLYIYEGGRDRIVSAVTRSWVKAEELAVAERGRRDPANTRLGEIEEGEAQKIALRKEKNITVKVAADRWYDSQKFKAGGTSAIYGRAKRRIQTWAEDQGIENLMDETADALDSRRGQWAKDAEKKYNRMGQTSQAQGLREIAKGHRVSAATIWRVLHDQTAQLPEKPA